jgi:putative transcriptional regulator
VTAEQLARARRVPSVRALQKKLKLTQEQFASRFHLPLSTVRDSRARRTPTGQGAILLRIITRDPGAVVRALKKRAFFLNFIGRTDNQHSEASGVALAYAGTSL